MEPAVTVRTSQDTKKILCSAVGLGALTVLLLTLVYFSILERFLGMRSGDGESSGGAAFLAGLRPSRDYFSPAPPLSVLKSAAVLSVIGNASSRSVRLPCLNAYCLRYAFLLAVSSFPALIFTLERRLPLSFPPGTLRSALSYNHDTILLAMLSGFITSLRWTRGKSACSRAYPEMAGVFAGLCPQPNRRLVSAHAWFAYCGSRRSIAARLVCAGLRCGAGGSCWDWVSTRGLVFWLAHLEIVHDSLTWCS